MYNISITGPRRYFLSHNNVYFLVINFNSSNTAGLAMHRLCGTLHSDKKPLEGYGKGSEHVHRWLPIEFINEK